MTGKPADLLRCTLASLLPSSPRPRLVCVRVALGARLCACSLPLCKEAARASPPLCVPGPARFSRWLSRVLRLCTDCFALSILPALPPRYAPLPRALFLLVYAPRRPDANACDQTPMRSKLLR